MSDLSSPSGQAPEHVTHPKAIKSFVKRAGRTTTGQAKAFELWGDQYVLSYTGSPLDTRLWGQDREKSPLILEIGFGMGDATAKIAALMPEKNFLGCEVHEPGVGALLKLLGEKNIGNVRILQHDAVEVLDHMLPEESLDGVHIFFPDPWHKKRHHKRRLIQSPLISRLTKRLKTGGYLHCATDWEPYAIQILQVLGEETSLRNTAQNTNGYAEKPAYRPLTKFENRGIRLGHGVWDLVFQKIET
jgi:tRNA (guanine-N7-)-methyltransferase